MSQSFGGITVLPYQGTTFRLPVKLPQGTAVPANQVPPSVCPVNIIWNNYWQLLGQPSSVGVAVNLQAASVQASILDRIASVKIDNTNSPNSVFVQFPDTNDVIVCPPFALVTMPVLTNLLNANIYIEGLTAGNIPTTNIFFYNVLYAPSIDYQVNQGINLGIASPAISRVTTELNQNFAPFALGDQFAFDIINIAGNATSLIFSGIPASGGSLYITAMQVFLSMNTGAAGANIQLQFGQNGAQGIIWAQSVALGPSQSFNGFVMNMTGQWKFPAANLSYFVGTVLQSGAPSGAATFSFSYTVNPNQP